jgi:hypothetical protein
MCASRHTIECTERKANRLDVHESTGAGPGEIYEAVCDDCQPDSEANT